MIWHLGKQYTAEEFLALPDSALAGSPAFPRLTREAGAARVVGLDMASGPDVGVTSYLIDGRMIEAAYLIRMVRSLARSDSAADIPAEALEALCDLAEKGLSK